MKNERWIGTLDLSGYCIPVTVYVTDDASKIIFKQTSGRKEQSVEFTKKQFNEFVTSETLNQIGSGESCIEVKFIKNVIHIEQYEQRLIVSDDFIKHLKKEIKSKYLNEYMNFLGIKPIKESNSNFEDYLTNLGFLKKDEFFKKQVHSYELIKDKKQILVICNKNSFDIHIKNQSFNGLNFERLKNQLDKILVNKQDKIFNENVIMTFSQFMNE